MKKKVLIVDDNDDVIEMVETSLKDSFETISAINGEDAVDLAVTEAPDLILMDLMMNGMDGIEAIHLIRQVPRTRSIPIIAITAGISDTVDEECTQIGCNDLLLKPFTASQLNSSITKHLLPFVTESTKETRQHQRRRKIFIVDDNQELVKVPQMGLAMSISDCWYRICLVLTAKRVVK